MYDDLSLTAPRGGSAGIKTVLTLLLVMVLAACSANGNPTDPNGPTPTDPTPSVAEPYVAKGRVVDASGAPLPNVEVFADNTAYYNMNLYGVSDATGAYRIELGGITPSSWRVGAYIDVVYNGVALSWPLHPDPDQPFAGIDGAVVDLTWLMTGEAPDGRYYGGPVFVYEDLDADTWIDDLDLVELTFVPLAPLLDGSQGASSVRMLAGGIVEDVAITRYEVAARYLVPQGEPVDLLIRVRNGGAFGPSVHADFLDDGYGGLHMELEVRLP